MFIYLKTENKYVFQQKVLMYILKIKGKHLVMYQIRAWENKEFTIRIIKK